MPKRQRDLFPIPATAAKTRPGRLAICGLVLPALLFPSASGASNVRPQAPIDASDAAISKLVRRPRIVAAAISSDGEQIASARFSPDPVRNQFRVTIEYVHLGAKTAQTVDSFYLDPTEAIRPNSPWPSPTAVALRWFAGRLVYTVWNQGMTRLKAWNPNTRFAKIVATHHRIDFDQSNSDETTLRFKSTDEDPLKTDAPRDTATRVSDKQRFLYSPPKYRAGEKESSQNWQWNVVSRSLPIALGSAISRWDSEPEQVELLPNPTDASRSSLDLETLKTKGRAPLVYSQVSYDLDKPGGEHGAAELRLGEGKDAKLLFSASEFSFLWTRLIGWDDTGTKARFSHVLSDRTELKLISANGASPETVLSFPGLLFNPCVFPTQTCQTETPRYSLLTLSTNLESDRLVRFDWSTRQLKTIPTALPSIRDAEAASVELIHVPSESSNVWARLYLPPGKGPFPLVFTQYASSPGFAESVGDEIPIPPLLKTGIAVVDMYSADLNHDLYPNIQVQIDRVRRPLQAMQWIADRLNRRGVIDPRHIAVTGLSYGSEIAMYAYWNWPQLCTVSSSSGGWDRAVLGFAGYNYRVILRDVGVPGPDSPASEWQKISPGENARKDLPPLLIQSGSDEFFTAPTWIRLREAGARVDWYDYPLEGHEKRWPANRWWAYKRNLLWLRFWLQGVEPSPSAGVDVTVWNKMRRERGC